MGFLGAVLDLFFPPKCVFCRAILKKGEDGLCRACRDGLPFARGKDACRKGDFFDVCVAPLKYEEDVRKSILRFKFGGASEYADVYGRLIADCVREHLAGRFDMITWVPLSRRRERERGYDQAMLLALAVALELGDVAVETLVKNADVRAQSSISDKQMRRANVSGVYEVKDPELVDGKRVLLIDDIVTTGATLSECARVLLLAGAKSVVCAALAQA